MKTTDSTRNAVDRTTLSPIPGTSDYIMHTQTRMCPAVVGVGLNYKLSHGICSPCRLALDLVSFWEYIDTCYNVDLPTLQLDLVLRGITLQFMS